MTYLAVVKDLYSLVEGRSSGVAAAFTIEEPGWVPPNHGGIAGYILFDVNASCIRRLGPIRSILSVISSPYRYGGRHLSV